MRGAHHDHGACIYVQHRVARQEEEQSLPSLFVPIRLYILHQSAFEENWERAHRKIILTGSYRKDKVIPPKLN